MAKPSDPPPPSLNDFLTAIAAINGQKSPEEKGIAKFAPPIIVAMMIGLLGWVGTSVSGVSTSTATMTVQMASLQKSVDDLSTKQSGMNDKIADLQSRISQHDLRLNAVEQQQARQSDRLRAVEGQQPIKRVEQGQ